MSYDRSQSKFGNQFLYGKYWRISTNGYVKLIRFPIAQRRFIFIFAFYAFNNINITIHLIEARAADKNYLSGFLRDLHYSPFKISNTNSKLCPSLRLGCLRETSLPDIQSRFQEDNQTSDEEEQTLYLKLAERLAEILQNKK